MGRSYPTLWNTSCASGVLRYFTNALAIGSTQCFSAFLSTTTVGVWMATVEGGTTIWSVPPAALACCNA